MSSKEGERREWLDLLQIEQNRAVPSAHMSQAKGHLSLITAPCMPVTMSPCTKQCPGFGVIFSLLYLLKDPDLKTAFHFKWELGICRITGHCLLLLSKVFYLGYVQELRASQSCIQSILIKCIVNQLIMPSYRSR